MIASKLGNLGSGPFHTHETSARQQISLKRAREKTPSPARGLPEGVRLVILACLGLEDGSPSLDAIALTLWLACGWAQGETSGVFYR
jgi:hypothetical protein